MTKPSSEDERELLADYERKRQRIRPAAKLGDVVAQLLAKRGYAHVQGAAALDELWKRTVGPRFASQTKAGAVKRGVLEVVVANSVVIMELTMQKKQLLLALQHTSPEQKINDLKFRVGSF